MAENGTTGERERNGSAEASPFTPPQISLPKGGGAIRGIDEKFAANPVTGTGSLTIPIATSPSRSSFGPQLSLAYNSGHSNGTFGMGHSLSLPSITRRTDKGLPRYAIRTRRVGHFHSYRVRRIWFRYSFAPIPGNGSSTISSAKDTRQKYRPRTEGLFARIERWTQPRHGRAHWRSISKDNILTVYGLEPIRASPIRRHPTMYSLADLPQLRRQGQRDRLRLCRRER